jgi:glycosyltransferase involved in cell wall biosynthesis
MNCGVVIPCSNEEATVAELVQAARQFLPKILVVDDHSTDATAARAADAGAEVISSELALGKGAALKAGFNALIAQGCGYALMMDGDGQHRPGDIPAFLIRAEQTNADLVIGNRMARADAIPWLRRNVNRWMSARISRRAGRELPDTQCGFRLVNLKIWGKLPIHTDHFEMESEMLLAFIRAGCRVEFVPIQVVGKGSHSHIDPVTDTWRWLRWWWSQ